MSEKTKENNSRRPYEKPAVQSEHIFETTALACGKCGRDPVNFGQACARVGGATS